MSPRLGSRLSAIDASSSIVSDGTVLTGLFSVAFKSIRWNSEHSSALRTGREGLTSCFGKLHKRV